MWGPNPIRLVSLYEEEEILGMWVQRGKARWGYDERSRHQPCQALDLGLRKQNSAV